MCEKGRGGEQRGRELVKCVSVFCVYVLYECACVRVCTSVCVQDAVVYE